MTALIYSIQHAEFVVAVVAAFSGVHGIPWLVRNLVKPLVPEPKDQSCYMDDYHAHSFDRPRNEVDA